MRHTLLRNLVYVTMPSLLTLLIIMEFTFAYIIPASQAPLYYFDTDDQILRYSTTEQQEGVFTIGNLAQQRAKWHINNFGWNSEIDYKESKGRLRIAIIGDSYVEALQVNTEHSLGAQLRRLVPHHVDIYTFGVSGATLSQYLHMSRYVRKRFDPDVYVFIIIHNDFDESLCSVKQPVGMLCFEDSETGIREASIPPYRSHPFRRLVRHSNLARYLVYNLKIGDLLQQWAAPTNSRPAYNANIDVNKVSALNTRIRRLTKYFLGTLKHESNGKHIVFLMDAPRLDIYNGTLAQSNVKWLNDLLRSEAAKSQLPFLDLTQEFEAIYKAEHAHFESTYDWHWNEKGHHVAADAIYSVIRSLGLLNHSGI